MKKGRGCSWGTPRIPAGKIGEPQITLGESPPSLKNPIRSLSRCREVFVEGCGCKVGPKTSYKWSDMVPL